MVSFFSRAAGWLARFTGARDTTIVHAGALVLHTIVKRVFSAERTSAFRQKLLLLPPREEVRGVGESLEEFLLAYSILHVLASLLSLSLRLFRDIYDAIHFCLLHVITGNITRRVIYRSALERAAVVECSAPG